MATSLIPGLSLPPTISPPRSAQPAERAGRWQGRWRWWWWRDTKCTNPKETRRVQHPRSSLALPVPATRPRRMSFELDSVAQPGDSSAAALRGWGKVFGQGRLQCCLQSCSQGLACPCGRCCQSGDSQVVLRAQGGCVTSRWPVLVAIGHRETSAIPHAWTDGLRVSQVRLPGLTPPDSSSGSRHPPQPPVPWHRRLP